MSRSTLDARPADMHEQDLWTDPLARDDGHPNAQDPSSSRLVGLTLLIVTLGATYAFASGLYIALALHNGGTPLHYLFLGISTLSFSWIVFGAANAALGVCALLMGTKGNSLQPAPASAATGARTALLFPVYHEDANTIADYIRSCVRELEAANALGGFAVFVISDSQTEKDRAAERTVFKQLATDIGNRLTFAYRNRSQNVGKKAGNVADWLRTQGGAYDYFVVFDADSVMSVDTLMRLVGTMELHTDTALIQTVPRLSNGGTAFARLQAFANNVFGPLSAAGLAAWQGASGNYWGHNAIIRTRAFTDCAGLPALSGAPPWGGHIQSHDFVEAALLRRAGWRVALISSFEGTYEQSPPTFVDMAVRDRRWMQGNLQHARILGARGLTPVSRIHLAMGIASYMASALWLLVVVVGLWLMWIEQQREISYFDSTKSLFPNWPTYDPAAALQLLVATMAVVFLPKLLGLADAMGRALRERSPFGGVARLVGMWAIELLHSMLLAPVTMLNHVRSLLQILLRQDAGWKPQIRIGTTVSLSDALRFHVVHVAVGAILAIAAASIAWHALLWLSPVVLGLVLSPIVTWATSHPLQAQRPAREAAAERGPAVTL
jgi:membrane glycosyltransferase